MPNDYYDHTTFPVPGSLGSSSQMAAELDAIETGFERLVPLAGNGGKYVFINAAASAHEASPNLTQAGAVLNVSGTVDFSAAAVQGVTGTTLTLPTSNNSAAFASTAFVQNAIASAAGASLPVQAGNAGRFLFTNGTVASWADAPGDTGATTAAAVVLTASSAAVQALTATRHGAVVTLPDATTLRRGANRFVLSNRSGFWISVADSTGDVRGLLPPQRSTSVDLADNATAAGTWVMPNALLFGVDVQSGNVTGASSNHVLRSVANMTATLHLLVLADTTTNQILAVAYDAATDTFGAVTAVRASADGVGSGASARVSATTALVASTTTANVTEVVLLTLTGTTISVGTAVSVTPGGAFVSGLLTAQEGSTYLLHGGVIATIGVSGSAVAATAAASVSGVLAFATTTTEVVTLGGPIGNTVTARRYAVAGGASPTQTAGPTASLTIPAGNIDPTGYPIAGLLGSGRIFALARESASGALTGFVLAPSAMTSTQVQLVANTAAGTAAHAVATNRVAVAQNNNSNRVVGNILTDNVGAAVAGTAVSVGPTNIGVLLGAGSGFLTFGVFGGGDAGVWRLTANGDEPAVVRLLPADPAAYVSGVSISTIARRTASEFVFGGALNVALGAGNLTDVLAFSSTGDAAVVAAIPPGMSATGRASAVDLYGWRLLPQGPTASGASFIRYRAAK